MSWGLIVEVAQIFIAIGVLLAFWQIVLYRKEFEQDHERSRRQNTTALLLEWNKGLTEEMANTRSFIEILTEEQCRKVANKETVKVKAKYLKIIKNHIGIKDDQKNKKIKLSKAQVMKIRFLGVQYLNLLETILGAWQNNSVDKTVIEKEFKYLLSPEKGHAGLDKFRKTLGGSDAYPAIEVFINFLVSQKKAGLDELAKRPLGNFKFWSRAT
ncbi:hypothetical protein [Thiomicrospira sp. ALE5]|uniref:hypothetical protein n=1 Tax=Thiomicrospira sp. ALE5 TaxID=748650 RepID=UPI0008E615EA|nr:hypothetical protein [Thiomicrospira sp. ALE5]SFR49217.1 hypothetical protein SAMN03092900_0117 [Thiomicrospira sp. ALE5]